MHDLIYRGVLTGLGSARALLPKWPLIVCLHSLSDAGADFPGGMAVATGFLHSLVQDARALGVPILSVADAIASLAADPAQPFLVLTFDDGYRGVFSHAYPLLRSLQVPFALFATTGLIDGQHPMWWDAAERLVTCGHSILVDGAAIRTRSSRQRAAAFALLADRFRATPAAQQDGMLMRLQAANPALDPAGAYRRALTWPMMAQMLDSGLVTVGAHTVTHSLLSTLDAGEIGIEFAASRRRIRAALGVDAAFMAYPFGQPHEIGPHAERAAGQAGYQAAFTTVARPIQPGPGTRLLALPRVLLSRKAQSPRIVSAYMSGVPARIRDLSRGAG